MGMSYDFPCKMVRRRSISSNWLLRCPSACFCYQPLPESYTVCEILSVSFATSVLSFIVSCPDIMQTRLRRGETNVLCSELTGAGRISSVSSFSFNCQLQWAKQLHLPCSTTIQNLWPPATIKNKQSAGIQKKKKKKPGWYKKKKKKKKKK